MSENTEIETVGYIKRKYSPDEFNPFKVMEWVYDVGLSGGVGTTISLLGFTDRFCEDLPKAWWHVLKDRGLLLPHTPPPIPVAGEFVSHTGAIIRFIEMQDSEASHNGFYDVCGKSDIILLCNKYQAPSIRSISRFMSSTKSIYNFSEMV